MFFPSAHRRVRSKSPLLENKFPACLLKTGGELLFVVGVPMGKGFAAATGVNSDTVPKTCVSSKVLIFVVK